MGFAGNLEDLSLVDVLQLLHLTKKSGTLLIQGPIGQASIALSSGFIVSAIHPDLNINIGEILLEQGSITRQQLTEAVESQRAQGVNCKPIIATLIECGAVQRDPAFRGLQKLIESVIGEVVSWTSGEFTLDADHILIDDEFRFFPETLREEFSVDTQAVLMNALKIFDERNAVAETELSEESEQEVDLTDAQELEAGAEPPLMPGDETAPAAQIARLTAADIGIDHVDQLREVSSRKRRRSPYRQVAFEEAKKTSLLSELPEEMEQLEVLTASPDGSAVIRSHYTALVFSEDGFLKHSIRGLCLEDGVEVSIYGVERDLFERIRNNIAQEIIPILVVDHRSTDEFSAHDLVGLFITKVKRQYPEIPVILLAPPMGAEGLARFYALGIRAVIPRPIKGEDSTKYVESMKESLHILRQCFKGIFDEGDNQHRHILFSRTQMGYLKRKINELRNPDKYVDVSLSLLQAVSENLERAIIFLVRRDYLIGVGSFGISMGSENQFISAMKIRIPLNEPSIFSTVVETGLAFHGLNDEVSRRLLYSTIGEPLSSQILALPLKANDKTIAIIYGDFGKRLALPVQVDALEILASQTGLLLENASLKKQIGEQVREAN